MLSCSSGIARVNLSLYGTLEFPFRPPYLLSATRVQPMMSLITFKGDFFGGGLGQITWWACVSLEPHGRIKTLHKVI